MFKRSKRATAIILALVMLFSIQLGATAQGTDFVAQYLQERGVTREQAGLPAAGAANAGLATLGNARTGGFTPSARVPHSTLQSSIQTHAAAPGSSVLGWIVVPGTNISFPVSLNASSNNHYLYRTWQGQDFTGTLNWRNWHQFPDTATYLDMRSVIGNSWAASSRNISVYSHNWTNLRPPFRIGNQSPSDRMFAQLKSFTDINFATQNPHIYFSTGNMEGIWRVFAVGYAHTTPYFFYNNPNPTRDQLGTLVNEWRQRSHINFNVPVDADDRIITLTTCSRFHGDRLSQRFVVVARLLRPGESENDVVTASVNPNIKHPDFSKPMRAAQPQQPVAAPVAPAAPAPATPGGLPQVDDPAARAAELGAPATLGQSTGTSLAG